MFFAKLDTHYASCPRHYPGPCISWASAIQLVAELDVAFPDGAGADSFLWNGGGGGGGGEYSSPPSGGRKGGNEAPRCQVRKSHPRAWAQVVRALVPPIRS